MRKKAEIYQVILDNFDVKKEHPFLVYGICNVILYCNTHNKITLEEYDDIIFDFLKEKPNNVHNKQFYNSIFFNKISSSSYWWKKNWFGNRQRKKFLRYLIKKNS